MYTPIQEIYKTYTTPPHLQLHMLHTAAVCQHIQTHREGPQQSRDTITQALLLHDIGNIVKFKRDTTLARTSFTPAETLYRKNIQTSFHKKYGTHDHHANVAICREMGVPQEVVTLVDHVDFGQLPMLLKHKDIAKLIINYCDLRVGPHGIISAQQRLTEAAERYNDNHWKKNMSTSYQTVQQVENFLFAHCSITPIDINTSSITPYAQPLRTYSILKKDTQNASNHI